MHVFKEKEEFQQILLFSSALIDLLCYIAVLSGFANYSDYLHFCILFVDFINLSNGS